MSTLNINAPRQKRLILEPVDPTAYISTRTDYNTELATDLIHTNDIFQIVDTTVATPTTFNLYLRPKSHFNLGNAFDMVVNLTFIQNPKWMMSHFVMKAVNNEGVWLPGKVVQSVHEGMVKNNEGIHLHFYYRGIAGQDFNDLGFFIQMYTNGGQHRYYISGCIDFVEYTPENDLTLNIRHSVSDDWESSNESSLEFEHIYSEETIGT